MNAISSDLNSPSGVFRPPLTGLGAQSPLAERYAKGEFQDYCQVADMAERIANARRAYNERVALAAYYLAQQRGFEPGRELEDWLAAEAQIGHPPDARCET
jgi:Protein of unknown function (DUF2934)